MANVETDEMKGDLLWHLSPLLFSIRYSFLAVRHLLIVLFALVLASCSNVSESVFTPQLVVQGYLYANEPLDSIVVRETIPIGSTPSTDRVTNAKVTISDGDTTDTLIEDPTFAAGGRYISSHPVMIQAGKTYSLRVEALGQVVTAATTVPIALHLDSVELEGTILSFTKVDTVTYPTVVDSLQSPGIHLWWSASPGAAGYGIEALSLDTTADTILDSFSDALGDSSAMGRYRYFIVSTDEQVVWPQFTRYGLNVVRAFAMDKNYEDFILGLYLSGSQFNNSTLDVQGGLGIFCSAARANKYVFLE
ncbi:MAG TPA: DUF4249 family protein [Candidatus Kapabacteria bacterium]|jgi:hypothetical protein